MLTINFKSWRWMTTLGYRYCRLYVFGIWTPLCKRIKAETPPPFKYPLNKTQMYGFRTSEEARKRTVKFAHKKARRNKRRANKTRQSKHRGKR